MRFAVITSPEVMDGLNQNGIRAMAYEEQDDMKIYFYVLTTELEQLLKGNNVNYKTTNVLPM